MDVFLFDAGLVSRYLSVRMEEGENGVGETKHALCGGVVARFRFATDLAPTERRALVAVTCSSCTADEVSAASKGRGQRKGATATSVSIWSR